ncbi:ABC transporter permease [Kordiimonas pumila]|uniref:ABC transporter permease n=1 Tax=Kordiimonas pumila TaxID=2161677 RepID=UPI001884052E
MFRNKLYSAINTIGLATGFAVCILVMLYVRHELSYDKNWANADTIARVNTTILLPGRSPYISVSASVPMKDAIETYFPNEVVRATRFIPMHPVVTHNGEAYAEDMHWTDPEAAKMFDLTVLYGDLEAALQDKASLAVSETFAEKYFGASNPVGKVLHIKLFEIDRDYRIGAVFKDLPDTTSLSFRALARFDLTDFPQTGALYDTWGNVGEHLVYVQLKSPASINTVNQQLPDLINTHVTGLDSLKSGPNSKVSDFYLQSLQRLVDIHLHPTGMGEMKPSGDIKTVRILVIIAGLVLLIACINFVNLVTAKSTQRAREVALRKVLGANRKQLIIQFIGETLILATIGLLFGLIFVELALPAFNSFQNMNLIFSYGDGYTILGLLGLVILTGFIAGIYPAFVISGFLPARVLRANKSSEAGDSMSLRNALVILQFTISIALIVATAVVYGQTWYATNRDPGYSKDNIIVLNNIGNDALASRQKALKDTILSLPYVKDASYTDYSPIDIHERLNSYQLEGANASQTALISTQSVDYDFLDTYKIPLAAGRFYSRQFSTDGVPPIEVEGAVGAVVINYESVKKLGLATAQNAIGKYLIAPIGMNEAGLVFGKMEIIGVTPDIYFQSPKKPIRAEVYLLAPERYHVLAVKYDGKPQAIASSLERVWKTFTNSVPFQYEFVDDSIAAEFKAERDISIMLAVFSLITVIVACLGLYGLAAFTAERRTKEIGIRKVLGAGVLDIVHLLVVQFSKPVVIANLIAWPLVSWAMLRWLENFPYRIDSLLLIPFCVGAGLISLVIAWLTVSAHAVKVARTNPIKALRHE